VAKKRRPARPTKRAPSARRGAKKKGTTKKRPRRAAAARPLIEPAKSLDLKVLRKQLALALSVMSTKVGKTPAAVSKLDDTRRRLSQWMTDIDDICTPEEEEICGPTMDLPLP
jgi:hypothetical protein